VAYTKVIQSGSLAEQWTYERAPSPKRLLNRKPRIRRVFRTERRADSITKCRNSFRRLVRANLSVNSAPALLTLNTGAILGIEEGYKAFTRLGQSLRYHFGKEVTWIAVPEFQKRGAVHFHVLIWGLPEEMPCVFSKQFYYDKTGKKHRKHVCPKERDCERHNRRIAPLWAIGYADIMQTDGGPKLSSYLAKYMSKAMHDKRLLGKKGYSASRNVMRPVSLNTSLQISYFKEDWGLDVNTPIALQKEYATMFLGRCVYKSYLLQDYDSKESAIDSTQGREQVGGR